MDLSANKRQRISAMLAVMVLHGLVIYGLIAAFGVKLPLHSQLAEELVSTFVRKPTPSPSPTPRHIRRASGGSPKPAGKKAEAAPVLAIPPVVATPTPMPAASRAAAGVATRNGAAEAGAGSGGGGAGNGSGAGAGDGADGGTDLRLISGEIRDSDYPRDAMRQHRSGKVHIRFTVGVNGRVTDCTVTRSSGNQSLDDTTCRLIMQRFRYEPSRDGSGRPYADVVEGVHEWRAGGAPADDGSDMNGNESE